MNMEFMNLPESIAANKAINEVRQAANNFLKLREKVVETTTKLIEKLHTELSVASSKLSEAQSELASEEIFKGKSTKETAGKVRQSLEEVERIENTIKAMSKLNGLSIPGLEKKLEILQHRRSEAEGYRNTYRMWGVAATDKGRMKIRSEKIEQFATEMLSLDAEILNVQGTINTLKSKQNKDKTMIIDATTKQAAEEVISAAVRAWNIREQNRQKLLEKIEANSKELERIKEENNTLRDAISNSNPESVTGYCVEAVQALCPLESEEALKLSQGAFTNMIRRKIRQAVMQQKEGLK